MATKKPTGLSIKRNGSKFACSWKVGDKDYTGQQFGSWIRKWGSSVAIGKAVKAQAFKLNLDTCYPKKGKKTLKKVIFRVRGKKGGQWSGWESKTFTFKKPKKPTLSVAKKDGVDTTATFTWKTATKTNDAFFCTDCEYQSVLVKESNLAVKDGKKLKWDKNQLGWKTGSVNPSGSLDITESGLIATSSYTRWFRIRSRGPAGASAWTYNNYVYASPNQANITEATATEETAGGYQVYVAWDNPKSYAYPIDTVGVEYLIATPDEDMQPPEGASWTEIRRIIPSGRSNAVSFVEGTALSLDQCLYVRVCTYHKSQSEPNTSVPAIAVYGTLKKPTITDITTDDATYRATVEVNKETSVADAFTVVLYRLKDNPDEFDTVGIIPSGETSTTAQLPNWTGQVKEFGVYNAVGTYTQVDREDGTSSYEVDAIISSDIQWQGGLIPEAPSQVSVIPTNVSGTVRIVWDWPWKEADTAVISWADHPDAWQSTDEPDEYEINNVRANEWNISGLETGIRWYFRVRLAKKTGDNQIYGAWSNMETVDLSSAPTIPMLSTSAGVITEDGSVSAFWSYVTGDGTSQAYAEICEAEITQQGVEYGDVIASTETAQHVDIYASEVGWAAGETHYLCVRVVSASGRISDGWSDPVPVIIAEPLEITSITTTLVEQTITVDEDTRTINALTVMPMEVTVEGAGDGGTTTIVIERAADYHIDRPSEEDFNGYEGETIFLYSEIGEEAVSIEREFLLGSLDDDATYNLICTIQDGLGQTATEIIPFEVHWAHQAVIPTATATIDGNIAIIEATQPEGYMQGDTIDIYRLSADKPELIVEGGEFGTQYVDPYPAMGQFGGHRVVYRTIDGDYITEDNELAWVDLREADGDYYDEDYSIIDFDGESLYVRYNMELSNSWEKNFKETRYLGGSVQGDWNKGYSRSSTVDAVTVVSSDPETIAAVRRLAVHDGICHIRTKDGSSYPCDIQVSDSMSYSTAGKVYEFSLKITRTESEELDGQTYAEWIAE